MASNLLICHKSRSQFIRNETKLIMDAIFEIEGNTYLMLKDRKDNKAHHRYPLSYLPTHIKDYIDWKDPNAPDPNGPNNPNDTGPGTPMALAV